MTTEIIIVDLNNAVVIEKKEPVVVSSQSETKVVVGGMIGPVFSGNINDLGGIDLSQLVAGSLLVYNADTKKWTATTKLENQTFESGQF
jgi:hypothetical protein